MARRETSRMRAEREAARAIRFLSAGPVSCRPAAEEGRVLLGGGDRGTIALCADTVRALRRQALVRSRGGQLELTGEGAARARRDAGGPEPYRHQHWALENRVVDMEGESRDVPCNAAESPLGALARRRTRNGVPFLSAGEFDAGERLRADYTRGQLMPRMSANWTASVARTKRAAGPGGAAELTEAALAARLRVEKALAAVGPELAGVLVDVCCFLKGLEQVESERGWPVRSAKVVLKTALGALERHYRPPPHSGAGQRILHWGAPGYRPDLK